jgi:hypothetical protein
MLVDATNKTNTRGEGHSHVVGSFLVQQEHEFTLRKMRIRTCQRGK